MRRLLLLLAVFGLAAGAGFAVLGLTERTPGLLRVADIESGTSLSGLVLRADRQVTPVDAEGLRPGARFRYSFHITNSGRAAMRHIVVRSDKVASPAVGEDMTIVAISDPSCWGVGHAECIFRKLEPGQTRTVQVTADSSERSRPGDRLVIQTFTGRFSRTVSGSIPLDVVGEARTTTGLFG